MTDAKAFLPDLEQLDKDSVEEAELDEGSPQDASTTPMGTKIKLTEKNNIFIRRDREKLRQMKESGQLPDFKKPTLFRHKRTYSTPVPSDMRGPTLGDIEHQLMQQVQEDQVKEYSDMFAQI